jgi:lysophospholipase L1-like esterase
MMRSLTLVVTLLTCLAMIPLAAAEPLQKGDRVVFLGDSITQAGAGPNGYVTLVAKALERDHKDLEIEVVGAGISGNKVPDLEARLDRDVLARKPNVVVIYIGINDVWHSQSGRGTPKEAFEKGLRSLIERIDEAGARAVVCTASVIGETTDGSNPLDTMLDEYCDISRQVAKETKTQLIDLRRAFLAHLKKHNEENKDRGILTGDTVHLNEAGNAFVAEQMLVALVGEGDENVKQASGKPAKVLRHVVLFKFKEGTTDEQIQEVADAFAELPKKIDAIEDFEWGTDNSPEMLSQGFTHCFLVTFRDEKGRDTYLPHPEHKKFVELALPRIEKVLVVDFWTK